MRLLAGGAKALCPDEGSSFTTCYNFCNVCKLLQPLQLITTLTTHYNITAQTKGQIFAFMVDE
jgi:hypothetical protein